MICFKDRLACRQTNAGSNHKRQNRMKEVLQSRTEETQTAKRPQKWYAKSTTESSFARDSDDTPYTLHFYLFQACTCFKCPVSPSISFTKALYIQYIKTVRLIHHWLDVPLNLIGNIKFIKCKHVFEVTSNCLT